MTWLLALWMKRSQLPRWTVAVIAAAALAALAGLGFWRAAAAIERVVAQAASTARAERDAHWTEQIATANAAVARAQAEQARAAMAADASVRASENRLETELKRLESENAALAGGERCGIGRDRVRLLDDERR